MDDGFLHTTQDLCKRLGVKPDTLRKWERAGRIKAIRTPGGHRRYLHPPIFPGGKVGYGAATAADPATDQAPQKAPERRRVCYCRVSTPKQRDDLERQKAALRDRYPNHEILYDIGSGINFKRRTFTSLVDSICLGAVEEVVVAHKDRLCRFGYDLVEHLCHRNNTRLVVLDHNEQDRESEFVEDLLAIVHVFSSRFYGLRSYQRAIESLQEGAAAADAGAEERPAAVVRGRKGGLQRVRGPPAKRPRVDREDPEAGPDDGPGGSPSADGAPAADAEPRPAAGH